MLKSNPILKKVLIALKIVITAVLCYLIITKLNWNDLKSAMKHSNIYLLQLAFVIMFSGLVLSAYKWKVLLEIHKIFYKYFNLLSYYLIGFFFNNFLPTNIGGDSYRLYKTYNNSTTKSGAILAIFSERITGILALLIIGFLGGVFSFFENRNEISLSYIKWFGYIFAASIPFLILFFWKYRIIADFLKKKLPSKIVLFLEHIKDYTKEPKKIIWVFIISFLFQSMIVASRFVLIKAVGADIAISNLALTVALATITALIPLTINGIGLMDGAYIYMFHKFGVGLEQAALVMVFIRALNIVISIIGGIIYMIEKKTSNQGELNFEEKLT